MAYTETDRSGGIHFVEITCDKCDNKTSLESSLGREQHLNMLLDMGWRFNLKARKRQHLCGACGQKQAARRRRKREAA